LTTGTPLIAGTTQYQISYVLPLDHGQAKVQLVAPAAVGRLMVFMPEDGSTYTAEGLGQPESSPSPQGTMRIYKAQDLAAQARASLAITKKAKAGAPGPQSSTSLPKVIAAVGGSALLAVGAGVALYKSPRHQKAADPG
jgi:hypothetical protein